MVLVIVSKCVFVSVCECAGWQQEIVRVPNAACALNEGAWKRGREGERKRASEEGRGRGTERAWEEGRRERSEEARE